MRERSLKCPSHGKSFNDGLHLLRSFIKTQICRKFGFINFRDVSTTYFLVGGCDFLQGNLGAVEHKNGSAISNQIGMSSLIALFFLNMTV